MTNIEFHEQQLAKARREGNRQMMGTLLGSLGNMYAFQGNIQKGIQCLEEAKQIRESLGDWDGVALTCKNLAGCYEIGLHDLATAVKYLEYAASVATPNNLEKRVYASMAAHRREELKKQQGW
jgi:TPR repeat protein